MAQDAQEFALADDYDTALHIVESIRRKAHAQHNQQLADRDSDDDIDIDDDVGDDDDSLTDDDGDNNNNHDGDDAEVGAKRELRRRLETRLEPPAGPPAFKRASTPKSHHALDALRIEPLVELHRIASGRNLRLKHISQPSKGALSPHALTPRAPSGRRPTERPSSWSSSSSSSPSLARQSEAVRVDFHRPQTYRSTSVGGGSNGSPFPAAVSRSPPAAARVGAVIRGDRSESRAASPLTPFPLPAAHPRAPVAKDRRCSFTISELALKQMGFSRSSPPGPETAPIHEDKQFVADMFARFRAPEPVEPPAQTRETFGLGDMQGDMAEEEEKVVFQFALWKKAGRSRQLPDAISTRCAQAQQDEDAASLEAAEATPRRRQLSSQNQRRSPSAMFSDLRVDSSGTLSPEAAFGEDDRPRSESPALHLTRSRSPTISASRSFRRAAESAPSFAPEAR